MIRQKRVPERMCVACRTMRPKRELVRVVASPDGTVSLDPGGRKPGRGAYLCRSGDCLAAALKGRKLDRALKTQVAPALLEPLARELRGLPEEGATDDGS